MTIQHILNISRLLGLFNCHKLANLFWNFITTMREQRPKTTGRKLCCKKLGISHDVKSFVIGSFLEHFVVRIANDSLSLVPRPVHPIWVHWLISSEIYRENSHKIGCMFFKNCFLVKLVPKISLNLSPKILQNLTSTTYQKPWSMVQSIGLDCLNVLQTEFGAKWALSIWFRTFCLWQKQSKIRWNVCFNF